MAVITGNAFLLSCRQLAEFFGAPTEKPDILAVHYTNRGPVEFAEFGKWRKALNAQLAHLSYERVNNPQADLTATVTRRNYHELRKAFHKFLCRVKCGDHVKEFQRCLAARQKVVQVRLLDESIRKLRA